MDIKLIIKNIRKQKFSSAELILQERFVSRNRCMKNLVEENFLLIP